MITPVIFMILGAMNAGNPIVASAFLAGFLLDAHSGFQMWRIQIEPPSLTVLIAFAALIGASFRMVGLLIGTVGLLAWRAIT